MVSPPRGHNPKGHRGRYSLGEGDGARCVRSLPTANMEQSSWGDLGTRSPFLRWDWLVSPGKHRLKGWGLLPGNMLAIKVPKNIFPGIKG